MITILGILVAVTFLQPAAPIKQVQPVQGFRKFQPVVMSQHSIFNEEYKGKKLRVHTPSLDRMEQRGYEYGQILRYWNKDCRVVYVTYPTPRTVC